MCIHLQNRRRYSRERASQSLEMIQFIHSFACLLGLRCTAGREPAAEPQARELSVEMRTRRRVFFQIAWRGLCVFVALQISGLSRNRFCKLFSHSDPFSSLRRRDFHTVALEVRI